MDYPYLYVRNGLFHPSIPRWEWIPWKALQVAMSLGVLWPLLCHTPHLLLCWDVSFHQGLALHAGHFDVGCNILEFQPQVLPTDGHFGPSLTRACHGVDLGKQAKRKENDQTSTRILSGERTDNFWGSLGTLIIINAEQTGFRYSEYAKFCPRPHLLSFNFLQNIQR